MLARLDGLRYSIGHTSCSDWEPAPEWFCESHEVRRDAIVLVGKKLPRTPEAYLYFVENEARAGVSAQVTQRLQEFLVAHMDSAFALNGFHYNGTCIARNRVFRRLDVIKV